MAPPSKLTPAVVDRICQQVAAGMSLRGAFRTAGAPRKDRTAIAAGSWFTARTGFSWLETGRAALAQIEDGACGQATLTEHEELCVDLVLRIEQGLGLKEAHWVGKLQSGTGRDAARWQWLLERHFPEEYKGTQRVELTGANGGPVVTEAVVRVVQLPELEPEDGGPVETEPGSPDPVSGDSGT